MGKEIEPLSTQQTRDQCPCHPIYLHRSDGTPSHAAHTEKICQGLLGHKQQGKSRAEKGYRQGHGGGGGRF
jgi:hypothetical protein